MTAVPAIGYRIGRRYEITGPVGSGGMGLVFAGLDTALGRRVAVKLLPPASVKRRRSVDRFLREARVMARLDDPATVRIFDRGRDGRFGPFLVMELLNGEDLARVLHGRGLPESMALGILAQIAAAVDAAHTAGVIHRDLKPANVFVLRSGPGVIPRVKLLDFGLAALHDTASENSHGLTHPGDLLGTLAYLAPERWQSARRPAIAGDVYALGVLAYEILAGHPPFRASSRAALRLAVASDTPPALRGGPSGVSRRVAAAVARALEKDPKRRYVNVRAFADALGLTLPDREVEDRAQRTDEFRGTSRYRAVRCLARGPETEIYSAVDTESGKQVALKRLRSTGGEALYRLKREFRAVSGIRHRNVVRLNEVVSQAPDLILVMELIDGVPLLDYVSATRERLGPCLGQLGDGLAALHARGLVHGDVQPSNVLVEVTGRLVLIDYGLSTTAGDRRFVRGTEPYLAPEALEGRVGSEGDLYAVGVLLHQALTGELPPCEGRGRLRRSGRRAGLPDSDLGRLCARLLAADLRIRPTARELAAMFSVSGRPSGHSSVGIDFDPPIFIGRSDALQAFDRALVRFESGTPGIVWIDGPSGMGKTALMEHLRRRITAAGSALVLSSRARQGESVPFPALDEAIDELGSFLLGLPEPVSDLLLPRRRGGVAQLFPSLTRLPAVARALAQMPPERFSDRQLASDDFRDLLRRVGDKQPVVLLLDDVQWIDSDSATLLAHAFAGPTTPSLLVVGALRGDDVEGAHLRALESSLSNRTLARVHLGPLPLADSRELVRALWRGEAPIDAVTASRLARLSGGVPFFAEMLVDAPDRLGADGVASLERALRARRRGLPAAARRALELLCVASRPLPLHLLLEVAGARSELQTLDPLLQRRLARLVRLEGISSMEPYHARIRDSIRRTLGRKVVTAHHRRLARALRGRSDAYVEASIEHLAGCGQTRAAATLALGAAEAANLQLAFDRAAALFGVVLAHGRLTRKQRSQILQRQALSLDRAGRRREAGATLLQAAGTTTNPAFANTWRRQAGTHLLASGDVVGALQVLDSALATAKLRLPLDLGQITEATGTALQALGARGLTPGSGQPPPSPDTFARIDLLLELALGLAHVDLRALPFACQALHAALDAGEPRRLHRAAALFIVNTVEYVPTPLVRPALELCRRLTEQIGEPYARALHDAAFAENAHFEGDFLAAEGAFERAERTLIEACPGATRELAMVRDLAVFVQYAQKGDFRTQLDRTQRWLAEAEAAKDVFHAGMLRVAHAIVWIAGGDMARARADLERAREESIGTAGVLEVAVALYYDIIDRYEANEANLELSGEARSELLRSPAAQTPFLSGYLGLHAAWRALRRVGSGTSRPGDLGAVEEILVQLRKPQMEIWMAVADALEGNLIFLRGRREEALHALDRAERRFRRLHMLCLAACVRKRRGQFVAGDLGERLEAEADSELLGLGVVDPVRWTGAYWSMFDARLAAERTQDSEGDFAADEPDVELAGR